MMVTSKQNEAMSGKGLDSKLYQHLEYCKNQGHMRGSSKGRVRSKEQQGAGSADAQQAHSTHTSKETKGIASSHNEAPTGRHSEDKCLRWENEGAAFYAATILPRSGRRISRHISRLGKDMVTLDDRLSAESVQGALKFEFHGMEEFTKKSAQEKAEIIEGAGGCHLCTSWKHALAVCHQRRYKFTAETSPREIREQINN